MGKVTGVAARSKRDHVKHFINCSVMEVPVINEPGFEHFEQIRPTWFAELIFACIGTKPHAFIPSLNVILIRYHARHERIQINNTTSPSFCFPHSAQILSWPICVKHTTVVTNLLPCLWLSQDHVWEESFSNLCYQYHCGSRWLHPWLTCVLRPAQYPKKGAQPEVWQLREAGVRGGKISLLFRSLLHLRIQFSPEF